MGDLISQIFGGGLAAGLTLVGVLAAQRVTRRGQDIEKDAGAEAREDDALAKAAEAALATTQRLEAMVDRAEAQAERSKLEHEAQIGQIRAEHDRTLAEVRAENERSSRRQARLIVWLAAGSPPPPPPGHDELLAEAERLIQGGDRA